METKKQGVSIQSQHGFVNIQFHRSLEELMATDDPGSKYITTITGPDESITQIVTASGRSGYANRLQAAIWLVLENNPMWPDVIHRMNDIQDDRRKTALDEAKTAELWDSSEPRYLAWVTEFDFEGYTEVSFALFRPEMSVKELRPLVILAPGRTMDDVIHWYTVSYIEQTFSKAEVKQLYAYFKVRGGARLKLRRAHAPTNGVMGVGSIPVGGGNDLYRFSKEPGYSLPFEVWGYFDLRDRDQEYDVDDASIDPLL